MKTWKRMGGEEQMKRKRSEHPLGEKCGGAMCERILTDGGVKNKRES